MSISRFLRRRLSSAGDDGFSLMEGIVAAVVLALGITITASLLIQDAGLTRNNGQRSAATNLAASKLERVRQLPATAIPDGRLTTTETVGNTTYTVNQDSTYLAASGATNACGGTGALSYKRVTVTVSWPGMGSTKPVQSETLRALGFDAGSGGLDSSKGALAVQVLDHNGLPASGAVVTIRKGTRTAVAQSSQTTGGDGCVVFTNLDGGANYFSSTVRTGSVAVDSGPLDADNGNGISANGVAKRTLSLAPAGQLTVNYTVPAGATLPAAMPITLERAEWGAPRVYTAPAPCPTGSTQACLAGDNKTVGPLYPGDYKVNGGSSLTRVKPGSNTASIELGAVSLTAAAGTPVTATSSSMTVVLGTVPAGGTFTVALPEGNWQLQNSLGATVSATVTPNQVTGVTL